VRINTKSTSRREIFYENNFGIFPLTFLIENLEIDHVWVNRDICRPGRVLEEHSGHFTLYPEDLRATRKQSNVRLQLHHVPRAAGFKRYNKKGKKNEKKTENTVKRKKNISYGTKCTKRVVPSFLAEIERPI